MSHKKGKDRNQYISLCLDDMVGAESTARVIDAFIDAADLSALGFKNTAPNRRGRNSYSPRHLTKLYLYGYERGVRSSRKLEELCHINVEAMWLMDSLTPDFKTIADFRKDNTEAFVSLFAAFTQVCGEGGLVGRKFAATPGTKIRASNAKKRNLSKKKLEENLERNTQKAKEFLERMDEADVREREQLLERGVEAQRRADTSEKLLEEMEQSGETEVSLTDTDARCMANGKGGVEVAYNVQASVDGRANIVVATDVSQNPADADQLAHMTEKTQRAYGKKKITALADKGYYSTKEIEQCERLGARVIIPRPKGRGVKEGRYGNEEFTYDAQSDSYLCPAGNTLECTSKKGTVGRRRYRNKEACMGCDQKDRCLSKNSKWRTINRGEGAEVRDRTERLFSASKAFYKKRQRTVEPVFGIIKHFMGGRYFLVRGLESVKAETALLFTGYNLKRAKGALGFEGLMEAIERYGKAVNERISCFYADAVQSIAPLKGLRALIRKFHGLCNLGSSHTRNLFGNRPGAISHTV